MDRHHHQIIDIGSLMSTVNMNKLYIKIHMVFSDFICIYYLFKSKQVLPNHDGNLISEKIYWGLQGWRHSLNEKEMTSINLWLKLLSVSFWSTLSMFYKGQSIWDGRQNFEKNKGQDLALSHIARDIFSRWKLVRGKIR